MHIQIYQVIILYFFPRFRSEIDIYKTRIVRPKMSFFTHSEKKAKTLPALLKSTFRGIVVYILHSPPHCILGRFEYIYPCFMGRFGYISPVSWVGLDKRTPVFWISSDICTTISQVGLDIYFLYPGQVWIYVPLYLGQVWIFIPCILGRFRYISPVSWVGSDIYPLFVSWVGLDKRTPVSWVGLDKRTPVYWVISRSQRCFRTR